MNTTITSCIQWYLEVTVYYTDGTYDIYTYDLGEPQCNNPCQPDPTMQTEVPDCTPVDGIGIQESAYIEPDETGGKDSIDIQKFIDCFDNIPNSGASFEVKLMVDIPMNGHSSSPVGPGLSPGHVFLRLTKTGLNGQQISQTIGFYPANGPLSILALTVFPSQPFIQGIIVNDGNSNSQSGHEFNASFSVNTSASGFEEVLNTLQQMKNSSYSLAYFNCAHFALAAFNKASPFQITSNPYGGFSQSPQGLYNKLVELKNSGNQNVEYGVVKNAFPSHGPC